MRKILNHHRQAFRDGEGHSLPLDIQNALKLEETRDENREAARSPETGEFNLPDTKPVKLKKSK